MFLSERMSKVGILAPKSKMQVIIDELYALDLLHIEDHVKLPETSPGEPLQSHEMISELLVHIRSLCSHLCPEERAELPENFSISLDEVRNLIGELLPEVNSAVKRKEFLLTIREMMDGERQHLAAERIPLKYREDVDYENLLCFVGFLMRDVDEFEPDVVEIFSADAEGKRLVAFYITSEKEAEARSFLSESGFIPLDVNIVRSTLPRLRGRIANEPSTTEAISAFLDEELSKVKENLDALGKNQGEKLSYAFSWLQEENKKAELPMKFGTTEKSFLINGWVPALDVGRLRKELEEAAEGEIMIKTQEAAPEDSAPVQSSVPEVAGPFQHFLEMFSLPRYGEIDPSIFLFLTFPLFFGFMLGDLGYGLAVLLISLLIQRATKGKPLIGLVPPATLTWSGIATMIFGLLFGEFFGAEIGLYTPLFHRVELAFAGGHASPALLHVADGTAVRLASVNADALLVISVLIGAVHISIGLLTGFINTWRMHDFWSAVEEKVGWLLLIPIFLWLFVKFELFTGSWAALTLRLIPGGRSLTVLSVLALILILRGEGMIALLDVPALFSNILSYARLMAIGLASVLLAVVANQLAAQSFSSGVLGWILGVFILLFFHVLNILFGIFGPFLHSLRLHYVEYFSKFYIGGGKPYAPFGAKI